MERGDAQVRSKALWRDPEPRAPNTPSPLHKGALPEIVMAATLHRETGVRPDPHFGEGGRALPA